MFGQAKQGRASLNAAGSATLFAAVSGYRHHLMNGIFSVSVGTGLAVLSLQETNSTGSNSAVMVGKISASAPMALPVDFGERGYAASATGSRIVLVLETSNSTAAFTGVGYTR